VVDEQERFRPGASKKTSEMREDIVGTPALQGATPLQVMPIQDQAASRMPLMSVEGQTEPLPIAV
jgi:hypothetical protein